MTLNIITPLRTATLHIVWLELNTEAGNMVIQPGHIPTVVTLMPQQPVTFCLKNGKQESIMVHHGIAQVTRTHTTLLIHEESVAP